MGMKSAYFFEPVIKASQVAPHESEDAKSAASQQRQATLKKPNYKIVLIYKTLFLLTA